MLGAVTKLSCTQVLIIGIKSIQQPTQSHYSGGWKSLSMYCHGAVGHDWESGAASEVFLVMKGCLHLCALSSMLLSIPGHHT